MTSINPYYNFYTPPPPPPQPPPPPSTNPDGTPREPEVIVVIAPNQDGDPYRPLLPYGGLTGAQENFARDMAFGMAGPEDRALMLGMNPYASDDLGRDGDGVQTLELNESDGWRNPSDEELFQLCGGGYNRELTASTRATGRGTELDDYSRALNGLQPRTRWDPDTLSPDTLTNIGIKLPGRPHGQRNLIGDGIDGMDFARSLVNKAGFGRNWGNRANWKMNGEGGIATFKGSDNFQVTLRSATNSNSGLSSVEVRWNGVNVSWHVVN
jgi:hypothetical protein